MKFHPDVLAAHAEFGGDLKTMQKLYDYPDLVSRISQQDAELERLRREVEEARALAFAEVEQKAREWAEEQASSAKAEETRI